MRKYIFFFLILVLPLTAFADGKDSFIKVSTDNTFNEFIGSVEITKHFDIAVDNTVNSVKTDAFMRSVLLTSNSVPIGSETYIKVKDPLRPSTYWNHKNDLGKISYAMRYFYGGQDYVAVVDDDGEPVEWEINLLNEVGFYPYANRNYLDAMVCLVIAKESFSPLLREQIEALPENRNKTGPMYKWGVDSVFEVVSIAYKDVFDWEITSLNLQTAEIDLKKRSQYDTSAPDSYSDLAILTQARRNKLLAYNDFVKENERCKEAYRILGCYLAGLGVKDTKQQSLVASFARDITEYKLLNKNWQHQFELKAKNIISAKKNKKDKSLFDFYLGAGYDAYAMDRTAEISSFAANPKLKAGVGLNFDSFEMAITGYAGCPVVNNKFDSLTWNAELNTEAQCTDWFVLHVDGIYSSVNVISGSLMPMFNIGKWLNIGVGGECQYALDEKDFSWNLRADLFFFDTVGAEMRYDVLDNTFTLAGVVKF